MIQKYLGIFAIIFTISSLLLLKAFDNPIILFVLLPVLVIEVISLFSKERTQIRAGSIVISISLIVLVIIQKVVTIGCQEGRLIESIEFSCLIKVLIVAGSFPFAGLAVLVGCVLIIQGLVSKKV